MYTDALAYVKKKLKTNCHLNRGSDEAGIPVNVENMKV